LHCDCGILSGAPAWHPDEVIILALTPGIPVEWIYAALRLGPKRRRRLRDMMDGASCHELALENAASIVEGDGWRMIEAVCPGYSGAAPLYTQLELRNDHRSDAAIARVLGVDRQKVRRWRVNPVFDPLTGVRLRPNRGTGVS
jgi:hypothetical protein